MEVAEQPLLTVEQMAEWYRVGDDAIALAEKLAAPAYDLQQAVVGVYTSVPLGIYLHPETLKAALFVPDSASASDVALTKSAVSRAADIPDHGFMWTPFMKSGRTLEGEGWVKVAYSPAIRGAGEALGFFPHADAAGNLSGSPSPIRSMLTTGLLGAGLGYAGGAAAEALLPDKWRRGRLRNTLAALGGAIGAAPGAIWGGANVMGGKPFNDRSLLYHGPDETPQLFPRDDATAPGNSYTQATTAAASKWAVDEELLKEAYDSIAMPWELAMQPGPTPLDVNIDAMGHTLWDTGASPQLAGATMGALAAAQQMPGGRDDDSGWVTPVQMANLAAHMGAGYVSGAIVGGILGSLTGMPQSTQNTLKRTGMYLGVVKSVLPRLFGQ